MDEREENRNQESPEAASEEQSAESTSGGSRKRTHIRRRKRRTAGSGGTAASVFIALLTVVLVITAVVAVRFHNSNVLLIEQTESLRRELGRYDDGYTAEEHDKAIVQAKEATRQEVLDEIRSAMSEDGRTPLEMVRELFPDDIILFHEGSYIFHPVDESIPKNSLDTMDFRLNKEGYLEYTGDDLNVRTFPGIDVSSHQGVIDWQRVAASGVKFAMVRLGFRGWGVTGSLNVDETFEANIVGAYENGIEVGVYWFPASLDEQEAEEEAAFVIETLEPYRHMITLPVALDLELAETTQSRVYGQPMEDVTKNAIAFLKKIEEAKYDTMVYGNLTTFVVMAELAQLKDYPTWIAWYDVPIYYPYQFSIWQYSAKGTVDGISTEVDLNLRIEVKE